MPIVWKIDVIQALKARGYSTTRLQKGEHRINSTLYKSLSEGHMVTVPVLDKLCALLECQPGDLIAYSYSSDDFPSDMGSS